MGYRSDIRIMSTYEGRQMLEDYVETHIPENEPNLFKFLDVDEESTSGASYFGFNQIKWYPGFPEIDVFEAGLKYLAEKDIPYQFAELGEDAVDIQFRSNRWTDLPAVISIRREFEVVGDFEEVA